MKFADHAFFTHDWSTDSEGRPNHDRVREVADECKRRGLKIWFEEDKFQSTLMDKLCESIDGAAVVVVFITAKYIQRVSQPGDDSCKQEFNYALRRRKPTMMIAVVMEKAMRNPDDWRGAVGMALGNHFYIDMSEGDMPSQAKIDELVDAIKALIKKNEEGMSLDELLHEIKKIESPASAAGIPHTILFGNTKYEGKIISGTVAHGFGEFHRLEGSAKGNKYVGEFSGSIPDGHGKFAFASGEVYEGEYRNGRKNGQGTYYFNSGAKYCGGYLDGKKNGFGVYHASNGDVYEGDYKDGKKHGQGTMTYKNGKVEKGRWDDDKFIG